VEERKLTSEELAEILPSGEEVPESMDIYILRGELDNNVDSSIETWISKDTLRIVNVFTGQAGPGTLMKERTTQMKDFEYAQIGEGIFYPVSYTMVPWGANWQPPVLYTFSSFRVNTDVPDELFTFDSVTKADHLRLSDRLTK
jgi:hypothetical protein